MLAKAGLAAGVAGLTSLAHAEGASANHVDPPDAVNIDFAGFNNVKHFGAAGDGVTDDTKPIQDAIDASDEGAATVYFPPGTYIISRNAPENNPALPGLKLPDKTVLIGHGPLSVLKKGNEVGFGGTGQTLGLLIQNKDAGGNNDIRIENITFDGDMKVVNNQLVGGALFAIRLTGSRIFVRGVEVRGCGASTINFLGVKGGAIEQCYVHDNWGGGIQINWDCEDVVVRGNLARSCGDNHIAITGSADVGGVPKRVSIVGNISDASASSVRAGGAIGIHFGEQITVVGNVFRGGAPAAVLVLSTFGRVHDLEIANNLITEAGSAGGVVVETARSPGQGSGVVISVGGVDGQNEDEIRRVNVEGNVISASRSHGVFLGGDSSPAFPIEDVAISGNLIRWNSGPNPTQIPSGVYCISSPIAIRNVRIVDNDIRDTKGPGIIVVRQATDPELERWDIQNNRIVNSGTSAAQQPGILLDGVDDISVIGNRAQDTRSTGQKTQNYGLSLKNETGHVLVTNNDFANNANHPANIDRSGVGPSTYIMENLGADPETVLD